MRHLLTTTAALGLAMFAAAPKAQAQTSDHKTVIGLSANAFQYKGNLGSDYWDFSRSKWGPGISINQYIAPGLSIGLQGSYAELKKSIGTNSSTFATNIVSANVPIKLMLNNGWALKEDAFVQPYILLAPGILYYSREGQYRSNNVNTNINADETKFAGQAGLGINFRISDNIGIFVQTSQVVGYKANLDGSVGGDNDGWDDRFLQHSAGLNIAFGKPKDEDMDGVPDRKDKCPGTPAGVAVDENGCPLDGDGDGVPDYQDKCPTEKGLASLEGCPDRDGDGVRDSEDECPDQAGLPALRGCPDSDGDGVADKDDKCPNTPAGTQVDATGCPVVVDSDGDGVNDDVDKCPGTPAGVTVDSTGCPLPIPAEIRKLEQPIRFETNSTVIQRSSYTTLDKMVQVLNDHPEYSLRISGYADSRGTDEYNQGLSERRAESAKTYFTGKGIDTNRIPTEGFGESKPVVPNTSRANMAKNRRAEFKFEFYIPSQPQP
ncbi:MULTISPECIES: OmpA family protein [Hymenobacter]|uniref:OmpA family protein n=1 Tax=Hymenobacter profundi TaxID=1982110 RepID=A0ABS6WZT1_9BACT|nr:MULTISPECIES: OmpA family protein [Hymenobacter]MBW3128263.1 OmpA family protein [Hymenobacter profundi]QNE40480.1 OmpA family protein [Hymenobacter sp. NBH84]